MTDKEILQKIEQSVKDSENWEVYHHLTDNLGVNIDVFKGYAYLFLDNGTPAEPGKPFSVQTLRSLNVLTELLDIVRPYIKR
ncbi:hypothetical protein QFX17_04195 [Lactobacillus helveticus]|uniref:hypothetical protein n=1 Tax=Lactobacillus helveticus TaxID=1587 RepID=UPI0021822BA0|nr:hypothetical protein [Lactobacillus helveticus]MCP9316287.1 hypothetical protein [Lactobacillus helveticus]MCT0164247.1 hypothetical protein [Lactobacillus helveticus]MCT0193294.1 hypothetical protein [Lactobacillus helveticus]MCT0196697.1 hypothetical protein [Lactobacillus helveticus]MDH5817469.1 hypothetical protein [Lactobacillus helveticus]